MKYPIECEYCYGERSDRGNDGYFNKSGSKFIHFYCIWELMEDEVWKKLNRERKKLK